MSLVMTVSEREAFLAEVRCGVLAVAEPDGGVIASPVWYDYEPGGNISFFLADPSRKLRAIDHSGRATLTVQDEGDVQGTGRPPRYVTVSGPVVENRPVDLSTDAEEGWASMVRYLGEEGGLRYMERGGESFFHDEPPEAPTEDRLVRLRPERWFTKHYGKAGDKWDEMVGIEGAADL
jgi:hypothetical protein